MRMSAAEGYFTHRASRMPGHIRGLSVDVYSPDLVELLEALEAAGLGFEPCAIMVERDAEVLRTVYHSENEQIGLSGVSS